MAVASGGQCGLSAITAVSLQPFFSSSGQKFQPVTLHALSSSTTLANMAKTDVQSGAGAVAPVVDAQKQKKQKKEKKNKDKLAGQPKSDEAKPASSGGGLFSLFGGKADDQLNDVFSKGVSRHISLSCPCSC